MLIVARDQSTAPSQAPERTTQASARTRRFSLLASLAFAISTVTPIARAQATNGETSRAGAPVQTLLLDDGALTNWLTTHSPSLAASQARVAQARSATRASALLPNPTLDLSVSDITVGETNPRGLARKDTLIYGAGITELVELGKRGPRIAAARLREQSAKQDHVSVTAELIARARLALGRTVYLVNRQRVLEESRDNARHVADLERTRLANAALSGIDYNRILLELANLEADIRRTQAAYASALSDCQALLGAPCVVARASEADLKAAAKIADQAGKAPASLLEHRADLEALRYEGAANRKDAALAANRVIPDVSVRVGYTRDNLTISGDQANTLSVGLSMPLPVFDHGQHDKARALSRALELEQSRRAALNVATADVDGLLARKSALEQTLSILESETLPRSASVLKAAQTAFDQGQFSLTDLLIARRTDIALRLNHSDARFELFAVRSELRQVLGLDQSLAARKD